MIITHPIELSLNKIQNYLNRKDKCFKNSENDTLYIKLFPSITDEYINQLLVLINNLGWFITKNEIIKIDGRIVKNSYKYSIESLKNDITKDYKYIQLTIQAKYDIEILQEKIPNILYLNSH